MRAIIFLSLAVTAHGHGYLSNPRARNLMAHGIDGDTGYGLSNPGSGDCHVTQSNQMNNNGCQGAVGVISFQEACYAKCGNDLTNNAYPGCVECKSTYVADFKANHTQEKHAVGGTLHEQGHTGVCGDAFWNRANKKDAFALGKDDAASDKTCAGQSCTKSAVDAGPSAVSVMSDGTFKVEITITAHHWGWSEFRLCEHGKYGENDAGLTQECFNKHVLSFDVKDAETRYKGKMGIGQDSKSSVKTPTDYNKTPDKVRCSGKATSQWPANPVEVKIEDPSIWAPEGSCCNKGGECGKPEDNAANATRWVFPAPINAGGSAGDPGKTKMHGIYTVMLRMPKEVKCSHDAPCTLQWLYMTGNSPDSYPEAFRNCADISTTPSVASSSLGSTVQSKLRGAAQTTTTTTIKA